MKERQGDAQVHLERTLAGSPPDCLGSRDRNQHPLARCCRAWQPGGRTRTTRQASPHRSVNHGRPDDTHGPAFP